MILSFNTVYVYFHSLNLLRVYNLEPIWMLFRFLIFLGGGESGVGGGGGGGGICLFLGSYLSFI